MESVWLGHRQHQRAVWDEWEGGAVHRPGLGEVMH
jgi:hypothetical protein